MPGPTTNELLHNLSQWIDDGQGDRDREAVTWGRLAKLSEEVGEVTAAFIGATGQNPRKGQTHSIGDVEVELLDVAVTALGALAHLNQNDDRDVDVLQRLDEHVRTVCDRLVGVDPAPRPPS